MKFINYKDGSLFLDEKEIADPLDEQIQIEIHFAGINRADILQKNGHYPPPSGESEIIGLECSGIVTKLGKSVKNFSLGDQVCAILGGGGYAEYVNVNEKQVMPLPKNLNLHEAGCLPETTLTVFENIFNVSKFQRDEAILIHGGSSGIGTTAISILKNYTKNKFRFSFTPHLSPMFRGILTTIYVDLARGKTINNLFNELKKFYRKEKFVKIARLNSFISTNDVINTNNCKISICKSKYKDKAIILSSIDNLIKGGAGQAIQNMNILKNFDINEGLR